MNKSAYLHDCLMSYGKGKINAEIQFANKMRDAIQKAMEKAFAGMLAGEIIKSGSLAKSTDINCKYDLDLVVPFKFEAVDKIEDMKKHLLQFLRKDFKHECLQGHREQKHSIGLRFAEKGLLVKMDIVPARESKPGCYAKDGYLTLFDEEGGKMIQTNIRLQIKEIMAADDAARNIIRLLKVWKQREGRKMMRGFIIELLVLRAFKDFGEKRPKGLWAALEATLIFIRDNIQKIRLEDPGNHKNILSDLLSESQKLEIGNAMRNMLNSIQAQPEKIKKYFPVNEAFN